MSLRSGLYRAARALGDINAVSRGRVGRRLGRRVVGRAAGLGLRSGGCLVALSVPALLSLIVLSW